MSNEFSRQTEADTIFDGAIIAYEQKKYAKALILFNKLLSGYTEYIEEWNLHQWLGLCYLKQEEFGRAIEKLLIAYRNVDCKESGPNCFDITRNLGYAYWRLNEDMESIKYYEEAENYLHYYKGNECSIDRYLYHLGKGRCYLYLSKYKDAILEFKRAEEELGNMKNVTKSDRDIIAFEMGRSYMYDGQIVTALRIIGRIDISQLHSDFLDFDEYYFVIGRCYFYSNDFEMALSNLSKVDIAEIHEAYKPELYFLIGTSFYHKGMYMDAKSNLLEADRLPNDKVDLKKSISEYIDKLKEKI